VDFLTKTDLTGRLRGLAILLDDRLTVEQTRAAEDLIDDDQFAPALEALAAALREQHATLPADLRRDFDRLSAQLGNEAAVAELLAGVPTEAGDQP
jgi:hypothetical protein